MKMKSMFADVGDRVAQQFEDGDVREGLVTGWRETNENAGYDLLVDWDDGTESFVMGFLLLRTDAPTWRAREIHPVGDIPEGAGWKRLSDDGIDAIWEQAA